LEPPAIPKVASAGESSDNSGEVATLVQTSGSDYVQFFLSFLQKFDYNSLNR